MNILSYDSFTVNERYVNMPYGVCANISPKLLKLNFWKILQVKQVKKQ